MKRITFQTKDKKCNRKASHTCRKTIARVSIVTALCAFSFLTVYSTIASAQCPGSTGPAPDPATCPWNTKTISITVGTCDMTVNYCWRVCGGGQNEVWVFSIQLGPGCEESEEPSILIDSAVNRAADTMLVQTTGVADCPTTQTQVLYYVASCWYKQAVSGQNVLAACSNNCYCKTTCDACFNTNHDIVYSNCSTVTVCDGSPDCTPDPGFGWLNGVCYLVCSTQ